MGYLDEHIMHMATKGECALQAEKHGTYKEKIGIMVKINTYRSRNHSLVKVLHCPAGVSTNG